MPNARLATFDYSFGGNKISQSWHDLYIWEQVLNALPPARILELGTFTGGMSGYLSTQAFLRDAEFQTYDVHHIDAIRAERPDSYYNSSWQPSFNQVDIRSPEGIKVVAEKIQEPGRTILFCDNGAKEVEMIIYSPIIKAEDVIAVHDWGTECCSVPAELKLYTPISGIYEELESMTRFFTK